MLQLESVSVDIDQKRIIEDISFDVKAGEIVSIIGPNGSGKSTLLKGICKYMPLAHGVVTLNGQRMKKLSSKQIALQLCMLSQKNTAPNDMTVKELVSYGRYPHKKMFQKLNKEDYRIIDWAMEKTNIQAYKDRRIATLSGGESQRVWIAMALAQRPAVLFLDEPTTFLDISHQHEVLELVKELNEEMNMTVVMVLHDLNQASKYSDKIVVMCNGRKRMMGTPEEVLTQNMIRSVYEMESEIDTPPNECNPRIHLVCTCKQLQEMKRRELEDEKDNRLGKIPKHV